MIFVGLDDTDVVDSPGTNQLARHLAARFCEAYRVERIVRHQLLDDPRVPYTSRNGSASMVLRPRGGADATEPAERLFDRLRPLVAAWSPRGSDPGLCVAEAVPDEVVQFGLRCQRELVPQRDARDLAARAGLLLAGLGGTEDGVIGALAAVGLAAGENDGRVIYLGASERDLSEVGGWHPVAELARFGVERVRRHDTGSDVLVGSVDLGKKLRPNLRDRQTVLYVVPAEEMACPGTPPPDNGNPAPRWQAVRLL